MDRLQKAREIIVDITSSFDEVKVEFDLETGLMVVRCKRLPAVYLSEIITQ